MKTIKLYKYSDGSACCDGCKQEFKVNDEVVFLNDETVALHNKERCAIAWFYNTGESCTISEIIDLRGNN